MVQVQVEEDTKDQVANCPSGPGGSLKPRFPPLGLNISQQQLVDQQVYTSAHEPSGTSAEQLLLNFQYATSLVGNSCSPLESLNYAPQRGGTTRTCSANSSFTAASMCRGETSRMSFESVSKLEVV